MFLSLSNSKVAITCGFFASWLTKIATQSDTIEITVAITVAQFDACSPTNSSNV